ncbi:MAG TPA: MipA/OmpV family protein [Burkholderiaceae bacterium]|nr:MipA/OmpV family protein [Burkholderiaceae bacterium]
MKLRTLLSTAALAACAAPACAADPVEPGPDVDAGLNPGTQRPLWELGLGAAALRLPDYRGSDQGRAYLLPLPYIVYRGTWLKADRDGARALLFEAPRVKVDVSAGASTPTRSEDNEARRGMPNLHGTFELGPNLNLTLAGSRAQRWKLDARLPLRAAFTVERSPKSVGATFEPNLNLDLAGVGGGWNLGLLTGPVFADRKYHAYFYGVDSADATSSRPAYEARAGYGGWRALAATSRRFGNMWVGAFARYDDLHGAAFDDSPLVRRRSALTFGIGVSWILTTSRELVSSSD